MDRPLTLAELYFEAIEGVEPEKIALRHKVGGSWRPITVAELARRVAAASEGLRGLKLDRGDRVAILSENRPEWAIADLACLTTGLVDVPIYPTLTAHQIRYLIRDSGSRAVVVSTAAQLAKIREIRPDLPDLTQVIVCDHAAAAGDALTFDQLLEQGGQAPHDHAAWRARALQTKPADLATIIYTSGTTGDPKGVMLTHGNIASNIRSAMTVLPVADRDECLSLLPLSHIFERMTGHYSMLRGGVTINYAESIEAVPQNLREIRPTVVAAVPRLYEKVYARALETAVHGTPLTRRVFFWAKRTAERWAELSLAKRPIPAGLALQRLVADRLVFSKFRKRLGGRLRYFISGGAPLSADIAKFFYAAGVPILEGYGLTETSPVITVNTLTDLRLGTVGKPIPGVEVRIASDGEILARGPNIMAGYLHRPDDTREAIDSEGWFHTGDIGELDSDGFLKITDRKKDLIATAGGKKIAPQPIENELRTNPLFSNAVMIGDRRKFPIVLLVPNFERLEQWARTRGLRWNSREELVALPDVDRFLDGEAKKHYRDLAQFEVPKRSLIVPRDFSIESGELTPKLSVKRRVVESHYQAQIDAIYQEAEAHGRDG